MLEVGRAGQRGFFGTLTERRVAAPRDTDLSGLYRTNHRAGIESSEVVSNRLDDFRPRRIRSLRVQGQSGQHRIRFLKYTDTKRGGELRVRDNSHRGIEATSVKAK
jgi:hypothetical protein